jgi:hypothetical protein
MNKKPIKQKYDMNDFSFRSRSVIKELKDRDEDFAIELKSTKDANSVETEFYNKGLGQYILGSDDNCVFFGYGIFKDKKVKHLFGKGVLINKKNKHIYK